MIFLSANLRIAHCQCDAACTRTGLYQEITMLASTVDATAQGWGQEQARAARRAAPLDRMTLLHAPPFFTTDTNTHKTRGK